MRACYHLALIFEAGSENLQDRYAARKYKPWETLQAGVNRLVEAEYASRELNLYTPQNE